MVTHDTRKAPVQRQAAERRNASALRAPVQRATPGSAGISRAGTTTWRASLADIDIFPAGAGSPGHDAHPLPAGLAPVQRARGAAGSVVQLNGDGDGFRKRFKKWLKRRNSEPMRHGGVSRPFNVRHRTVKEDELSGEEKDLGVVKFDEPELIEESVAFENRHPKKLPDEKRAVARRKLVPARGGTEAFHEMMLELKKSGQYFKWVLTVYGDLFVLPASDNADVKHSVVGGGLPAFTAGTGQWKKGNELQIDNKTGHYFATTGSLHEHGVPAWNKAFKSEWEDLPVPTFKFTKRPEQTVPQLVPTTTDPFALGHKVKTVPESKKEKGEKSEESSSSDDL